MCGSLRSLDWIKKARSLEPEGQYTFGGNLDALSASERLQNSTTCCSRQRADRRATAASGKSADNRSEYRPTSYYLPGPLPERAVPHERLFARRRAHGCRECPGSGDAAAADTPVANVDI
jgi:hypothetical protein